jgi:predicted transcriptional regulator
MKILCETVFSSTLPTLRAIIASEMVKNYNLKENEIAQLLGIGQSTVSQYISGLRGKRIEQLSSNKKFMKQIKQLTKRIVERKTKFYNEIARDVELTLLHEQTA